MGTGGRCCRRSAQGVGVTVTIKPADLTDRVEAQRIDDFINGMPGGTPFHLTGWSRAVERGCGQRSYYLAAEDRSGGIVGVLPLTEVHSPFFGRALVSSGFAVNGGVLADDPLVAKQLVEQAVKLAAQLKCPTLELRGGAAPGGDWHVDHTTYLGFARDLATDDAAELLAIPRKQRAEVRRALGFDLEIVTGANGRAEHYAVYAESVRNLGTPVFPRALFESVLDEFGDAADILTVRHDGKAMASVLSLYWRGTVMPYWGGGTREARTFRANDMMYYALMCHARTQKGCTRFDFGRSKTGTGPSVYKQHWGFEGEPLTYASLSVAGGELRDINPMNPKLRLQVAAWQRLPLWLANRIGPMISRGLG